VAKMEIYGGNPKGLIHTPEIDVIALTPDQDYILLGSDGIFDYLNN
jgi:serine/threonine protein phosphatase PrpC